MSKAATWTTRDGQVLKIQDMIDTHLINTIRYLERNVPDLKHVRIQLLRNTYLMLATGEMGIEYLENKIEALYNMSDKEFLEEYSVYNALLWHAKRRKLNWRAFK